jgi:hypothetical protein
MPEVVTQDRVFGDEYESPVKNPAHNASESGIKSTRLKMSEHMRKAHKGKMLRQESGFNLHLVKDDETAVDEMLESFDENGDGVFSRDEVRELVYSFLQEEEKVQNYKRLVYISFFVILCYALGMYGIILQANEVTKLEIPSGSGVMRAKEWGSDGTMGDVVQTGLVKSYASILDFPALPLETLREVKHLTVEVDNTPTSSFNMYQIIGFEKHSSNTLSLFTPVSGTTIEINKGLGTARVAKAGGIHRDIIGLSARRNLLEVNVPRTYSWDDAKAMHRRSRRLDDTDYTQSSDHLGPGFDTGGFCQFQVDESTSQSDSAAAYNMPNAAAGFCEDTPAGDRGAACLMGNCDNLAETCYPKNGEFQMFYGGIGYSYPEAWTMNWKVDEEHTFAARRRATVSSVDVDKDQGGHPVKHTKTGGAPTRRLLGRGRAPLWRNTARE